MNNNVKLWLFLLSLSVGVAVNGQTYDPELPPEPNAVHRITLSASPQEGGTLNGSGSYRTGASVRISTNPRENYQFEHWLHNGEIHTYDRSFYYTVSNHDDSFVAVFTYIPPESVEYKPALPGEPGSSVVTPKHTLYLESDPYGVCTFNISSGQRYTQGVNLNLHAYLPAGYKYSGWFAGDSLISTSRDIYFTMGESDMTLTARAVFDPQTPDEPHSDNNDPSEDRRLYINIVSDDMEMGTVKTTGITAGGYSLPDSTVSAKAQPKPGYHFVEWVDESGTLSTDDVISFKAERNRMIYAVFEANMYTVTFIVDDDYAPSVRKYYGSKVTPPDVPIITGYTFMGWKPEFMNTVPAYDVTYEPVYEINRHTVTFLDENDSVLAAQTLDYNSSIIVPFSTNREGYTFLGWTPALDEYLPDKDVTYKAGYQINSHRVQFVDFDNSIISDTILTYGSTVVVPQDPVREGRTFTGWSSDIVSTVPDHDLKYEATYTINSYYLTYLLDGDVYKSQKMYYGTDITPIQEPSQEGYTFSGWQNVPKTMPAYNDTIIGYFTINKYILSYQVDGQVYLNDTLEFGAVVNALEEPVREGYTFSGWSKIPSNMPARNVTVSGSFTINRYQLTYLVDDEFYYKQNYNYGTVITAPDQPVKEGYSFSGWQNVPETMPARNDTILGFFTINSYVVSYVVDGQEYSADTLEYGAVINALAEPVREGYTFSGWSRIPSTMPARNLVISGNFTVNRYQLTFIVDGEFYNKQNYNYGSSITLPETPVREGYTFSGWNKTLTSMPAYNDTITGYFTVNSYRVTYYVDGEVYFIDTLSYGESFSPIAEPVRVGETFSGWKGTPGFMPARDIVINGTFDMNSYTITYYVDGEIYHSEIYSYGSEIKALPEPVRDGYTFSGWSEIPAVMSTNDIEVTGTFSVNSYTVTYYLDGEFYHSDTYTYGSKVDMLSEPTKEGYSFSGWSKILATMPSRNDTITGYFTVNVYHVTYLVDGEIYYMDSLTYGESFTPIAEPTRVGETFSGWKGVPDVMPAHDIVINGSFNTNSYTITYYVDGEVYNSELYPYGSRIKLLTAPEREGYTFSGWSEIPPVMPNNDLEVYGTFSVNMYLLKVIVNDNVVFSDSIAYGTKLSDYLLALINKGIDLSGWELYSSMELITMPAHDVIIEAVMSSVRPTVSDHETTIIDMNGRRISTDNVSDLSPGMYIIDGRKILIK